MLKAGGDRKNLCTFYSILCEPKTDLKNKLFKKKMFSDSNLTALLR